MIYNTVWQTLEMYCNNPIYWYECKIVAYQVNRVNGWLENITFLGCKWIFQTINDKYHQWDKLKNILDYHQKTKWMQGRTSILFIINLTNKIKW